MFGYVTIAENGLSDSEKERYRSAYCGLCRTLYKRYGQQGRLTLSYDFTFLYLLLTSLYEPEEELTMQHCAAHPLRPHPEMINEFADYCSDMNFLLSYYKLADNWNDDRNPIALLQMKRMNAYREQLESLYPDRCKTIAVHLARFSELEKNDVSSPDEGANATAEILGAIYHYRKDLWGSTLRNIGEGIGRFIYLMDAYEDLPGDLRHGRYNPLKRLSKDMNYEAIIKESLTMLISEATAAFELLPLEKDIHLLRNILYAGCWNRYEAIRIKQEKKNGVLVKTKNTPAR